MTTDLAPILRARLKLADPSDDDWTQHYNAMTYRLLDGDLLMRKCLDDAQRALSVLIEATRLDGRNAGVAGHSYGGLTALYHAALVVSGTKDRYSRDADQVVARVGADSITELRVDDGHDLDQARFDAIVDWIVGRFVNV